MAEDVQAVEARVAEADRRCVGAEEAAAALSRDIDEERARARCRRRAGGGARRGAGGAVRAPASCFDSTCRGDGVSATAGSRPPRHRPVNHAGATRSPRSRAIADDIAVGAELSGKFSGDGQYYDVVVEEVTESGYKVLFTEYGNSEELPRTDLKQRDNSKAIKEIWKRAARRPRREPIARRRLCWKTSTRASPTRATRSRSGGSAV